MPGRVGVLSEYEFMAPQRKNRFSLYDPRNCLNSRAKPHSDTLGFALADDIFHYQDCLCETARQYVGVGDM